MSLGLGIFPNSPERLCSDAQTWLMSPNDHEQEKSWCKQHWIVYKALTDPETMY